MTYNYIYHSYEIAHIMEGIIQTRTVTPEFIIIQYIHKKLEGITLFFFNYK